MIGFIYTFSTERIGGIETYNTRLKEHRLIDCAYSLYENKDSAVVKLLKIGLISITYKNLILSHINLLPIAYFRFLFTGKKSFVVVHGTEAWIELSKISLHVVKFIPVSQFTQDVIVRRNFGRRIFFTRILANSFDNYFYSPLAFRNESKFLLISRLDAVDSYKAVDSVLRSVKILQNISIKISLTIIGKGDDYFRLEALKNELALDSVNFLSFVPDLKEVYESHSVFVLPSSGEGFGIVYLEALNFGLNIIALGKGAQYDFLKEYSGFFPLENQDPVTIALAMKLALENFNPVSNLTSGCKIKQNFSKESFEQNLNEIFR